MAQKGINKYQLLLDGEGKYGHTKVPATLYRVMAPGMNIKPRLFKAKEFADVAGYDMEVIARDRETGEEFAVTDIR